MRTPATRPRDQHRFPVSDPNLATAPVPDAGKRRVWPVIAVWAAASTAAAAGLLALRPTTGLSMEILSLVMLAPAVGAAACWPLARRLPPMFGQRVPARRFGLSVGLSIVVVALCFATMALFRGEPPQLPATVAGLPVAVMILGQTLGALAEEIGFRGILFHALGVRLPRAVAAIAVGLLFGVWHVQYFALPLPSHAAFVLGTVALTVTMAYVMTGTFWQRMVVCTIIHVGANLALAFTGGETVPMTAFGLTMVVGCVIVTPIAVVLQRRGARRETA